MHPDYESRRPQDLSAPPTHTKIPYAWTPVLESIARAENDDMSGLLLEGVIRVAEARRSEAESTHTPYIGQRPRGLPTVNVATRMPQDWKTNLQAVAESEGSTPSHLLYEGIVRVLLARSGDADYLNKLRIVQEKNVAEVTARLKNIPGINY